MIGALEDIQVTQSKDRRLVYRDATGPEFEPEDWARPVDVMSTREMQVSVRLNLVYDGEHAHLVRALLKAVQAIERVVDGIPDPNDPKCRHDGIGQCIHPAPWLHAGARRGLPLKMRRFEEGRGWVCERCNCLAVTEEQAVSNEPA